VTGPHDFHLVTRWEIRASTAHVFAALSDLSALSHWWPGVEVERATSAGALLALRGALHSRLRIDARIVEARPDAHIRFETSGDLTGRGIWTLRAAGRFTEATLKWDVALTHRWLGRLPGFFRPLLRASHARLMWRGERGLNRLFAPTGASAQRHLLRLRADRT
jgi:uncharacterized protein YndB with AHSA1/START domain